LRHYIVKNKSLLQFLLNRKAAHIFKYCTIPKLTVAGNERPFGHRTKGFFAFLDRVMGQTSDGNLHGNASD